MTSLNCSHEKWQAKIIPLSDGRPSLREFCHSCGQTWTGSRLGFSLPMIADEDMKVLSYKHKDKTLGEIAKIDLPYIRWLALESKASERIKKSAARIFFNVPYVPPKDGEIYDKSRCYNPFLGRECLMKMNSYDHP